MQILRLLAARRAASTSTSAASERRDRGEHDDEGPFFDLDFSSVRASSFSSGSPASDSDSDSDESCAELDFIISLQRSRSASPPLYSSGAPPQLKFCASEPPARATSLPSQQQQRARKRGISGLRTLSFRARKAAAPLYGAGRHSFSSGRRSSFARSSSSSAQSLRLFMDSPSHATEDELEHAVGRSKRAPSRDVIRRCLAKISRRLRKAAASPRAADTRGLRRLRKCRSASSAVVVGSARDDDSAVEKQDGIAGAIAHCKESLHRASTSECDSPLVRSRSDPGKCEAA